MPKGRKQGQVKSKTVIKDSIIDPYYIEFDGSSYDVLGDNKTYHCTSLSYALTKITGLKMRDKADTMKIGEYINEIKNMQSQIFKTIEI